MGWNVQFGKHPFDFVLFQRFDPQSREFYSVNTVTPQSQWHRPVAESGPDGGGGGRKAVSPAPGAVGGMMPAAAAAMRGYPSGYAAQG